MVTHLYGEVVLNLYSVLLYYVSHHDKNSKSTCTTCTSAIFGVILYNNPPLKLFAVHIFHSYYYSYI